jgi:hypothetical protein
VKALLPVGIVLVVLGLALGFWHQVAVAVVTGLPTSGIGWMQATGFVLAAVGAILIGVFIGAGRKRRAAAAAPVPQVRTREVRADASSSEPRRPPES